MHSFLKSLGLSCCLFLLLPLTAAADGMPEEADPSKATTLSGRAGGKPIRQAGAAAHDSSKHGSTKSSAKATGNTKALSDFELGRYQYCGQDSDCMVAINGCCDCVNGGTEVAVNKERYEAFRARFDCLHVACGDKLPDPPCENGVVSCVNHKCNYYDDRPQEQF